MPSRELSEQNIADSDPRWQVDGGSSIPRKFIRVYQPASGVVGKIVLQSVNAHPGPASRSVSYDAAILLRPPGADGPVLAFSSVSPGSTRANNDATGGVTLHGSGPEGQTEETAYPEVTEFMVVDLIVTEMLPGDTVTYRLEVEEGSI